MTYLRVDGYRHRLAARTAAAPVLHYIGFDVGGPDALAEWKTTLAGRDIDWRPGSKQECLDRQVAEFIEFKDPDGHSLALAYGFEIEKDPVQYTRELNVTGLGHVLLTVRRHAPTDRLPQGTPVDIWGGDVQSTEFELG